MWLITIVFGVALAALGGVGYSMSSAPTSLIPAGFGAVLIVCGILARNDGLRKHVMHLAAMVGLLGFLVPAVMAGPKLPKVFAGEPVLRANGTDATHAVVLQAIMAVICLIFVALCVNSFVQARILRKKTEHAAV